MLYKSHILCFTADFFVPINLFRVFFLLFLFYRGDTSAHTPNGNVPRVSWRFRMFRVIMSTWISWTDHDVIVVYCIRNRCEYYYYSLNNKRSPIHPFTLRYPIHNRFGHQYANQYQNTHTLSYRVFFGFLFSALTAYCYSYCFQFFSVSYRFLYFRITKKNYKWLAA